MVMPSISKQCSNFEKEKETHFTVVKTHVILWEEQMNRKNSHQIFRCGWETRRSLKENTAALRRKQEKPLWISGMYFIAILCKENQCSFWLLLAFRVFPKSTTTVVKAISSLENYSDSAACLVQLLLLYIQSHLSASAITRRYIYQFFTLPAPKNYHGQKIRILDVPLSCGSPNINITLLHGCWCIPPATVGLWA